MAQRHHRSATALRVHHRLFLLLSPTYFRLAAAQQRQKIPFYYVAGLSDQDRWTLFALILIASLSVFAIIIRKVLDLLGLTVVEFLPPQLVLAWSQVRCCCCCRSSSVQPTAEEMEAAMYHAPEGSLKDGPRPIELGMQVTRAERLREAKAAEEAAAFAAKTKNQHGTAVMVDKSIAARVRSHMDGRAETGARGHGEEEDERALPTLPRAGVLAAEASSASASRRPSLAGASAPLVTGVSAFSGMEEDGLGERDKSRRPSQALSSPNTSRRPSVARHGLDPSLPMPKEDLTQPGAHARADLWGGEATIDIATARRRPSQAGGGGVTARRPSVAGASSSSAAGAERRPSAVDKARRPSIAGSSAQPHGHGHAHPSAGSSTARAGAATHSLRDGDGVHDATAL